MAKKRTVCPFYTKRMTRAVKVAQSLPVLQRLAVHAGVQEALRARRAAANA